MRFCLLYTSVIQAVINVHDDKLQLNSFIAVIDAKKCKTYSLNFGEFFNNQIEYASTIILSRTQDVDQHKLEEDIQIIKTFNTKANIITTPWDDLTGDTIMNALEKMCIRDRCITNAMFFRMIRDLYFYQGFH